MVQYNKSLDIFLSLNERTKDVLMAMNYLYTIDMSTYIIGTNNNVQNREASIDYVYLKKSVCIQN